MDKCIITVAWEEGVPKFRNSFTNWWFECKIYHELSIEVYSGNIWSPLSSVHSINCDSYNWMQPLLTTLSQFPISPEFWFWLWTFQTFQYLSWNTSVYMTCLEVIKTNKYIFCYKYDFFFANLVRDTLFSHLFGTQFPLIIESLRHSSHQTFLSLGKKFKFGFYLQYNFINFLFL